MVVVPDIRFEDLKTSTLTMMVYSNINIDLKRMYDYLPIYEVDVPLTKKKHYPDVRKIVAPYGSIISLRYIDDFRGVISKPDVIVKRDLRDKLYRKEQFTSNDMDTIRSYGRKELKKHRKNHTHDTAEHTDDDLYEIGVKYLTSVQHFRNQVTCIVTLANNKKVNIMVFNNSYKIVGCRSEKQAEECIMILWEAYIRNFPSMWTKLDTNPPRFVFEKVMINIGFKLGFHIVRSAFNEILNDTKYRNVVHISKFVSTGTTSVNTKFYPVHPADFAYYCLEYPKWEDTVQPTFIRLTANPYQGKSRPKKEKDTTVLSFYSSKIIMSGRYMKSLRDVFLFLMRVIRDNKDVVAERLVSTDVPFVM
uniref:Uncharacterized protein n=1 Tax=viral metagenome TaxID=1070528 RepID=A0A6C0LZX5_9ZZZZ